MVHYYKDLSLCIFLITLNDAYLIDLNYMDDHVILFKVGFFFKVVIIFFTYNISLD